VIRGREAILGEGSGVDCHLIFRSFIADFQLLWLPLNTSYDVDPIDFDHILSEA